jgi:hypothetical protein
MHPELMRRPTVVMPEAAVGMTVVGVVRDGVIRRRRLLRESGRRRDTGRANDDERCSDLRS